MLVLKIKRNLLLSSLSIVLLSTGCTKLGPEFKNPKQIKTSHTLNAKDANKTQDISKWWEMFNDETLNILVQKTYEQNLDLQSAGMRILQARALVGISEGLSYPQKQTLSGGAITNRVDGNGFGTVGAGFDMGWEMDVWGKYARGIESADATLLASIASYNDIMVSVIAEVARNYINYRTSQERIAYAKRNISIQEYVTKITKIQFNTGNVSELDMQQSLSQLHSTKSLLPSFKLTMIKSRNALSVLMGISPIEVEKFLHTKDEKDFVQFIDTKKSYIQLNEKNKNAFNVSIIPQATFNEYHHIDASSLSLRPDLKVAEYLARSHNANIGLTQAELYPSFTLLGSIGLSMNNADGSWSSATDSINVSAGPAFSWNILQYDRIKNKIRAKDAQFEESLLAYNKKVLIAVSEVSNALNGYKLTKVQQKENEAAMNATVRAFNISMIQYNDGLVGYQRLLSTVENLTRNQDRHAQTKGSLSINLVTLYKSLGGGWQMNQDKNYISLELSQKMQERTDWGNYFDINNTKMPRESN